MTRRSHSRVPARLCGILTCLLLALAGCQGGETAAPADGGTPGATPAWTGVLPPDRRTTWNPGLNAVGGIPYRATVYRTLSPGGGDDTAAINAALAACPANQVVKLTAGDFHISGEGLVIGKSNVTLRGSGAGTRLLKTDYSTSQFPVIIIGSRWSSSKFLTSVNLAADGVKGSNVVTLASAPSPALSAGEIVYLDQLTNPNLTVWSSRSPSGDSSRGWFSRLDRPITQILEVASVAGTTVTFTTPLHITFQTAYAAQLSRYGEAWRGGVVPATKWSGIEDLYVERGQGGDGGGNIHLFVCAYCWVKNVESAYSGGTGVNLDGCFRSEVRDSYIHTAGDPNPGGGGYLLGVNSGSSDNLIENNIVWNGNKVIVMRASGGGNVIGYNYMEDGYGAGYKTFVESGLNASHMTTPHMELFEGNQAFNFDGDSTWGNSIYITVFRNHLTGIRRSLGGLGLTDTANRRAIGIGVNHWWYSFLGNILGTLGQAPVAGQTRFVYETSTFNDSDPVPMWKIGYNGDDWNAPQDATTLARTIRHGNFDYVTNSVVWDPANADHNLPASLYLTAKPAFFGNNPWPWVDPTGTTKLYTLPARARFDAGPLASSATGP
jgi:hypothetical protein